MQPARAWLSSSVGGASDEKVFAVLRELCLPLSDLFSRPALRLCMLQGVAGGSNDIVFASLQI
jgi:hypothetical protein